MDIIGKWKVKEFNLATLDGVKNFTPDNLPDSEEFEAFSQMTTMLIEFTPDGLLNTLLPASGEIDKEEFGDVVIRDDGYALIESTTWKEENGKFFFDSRMEGDIMGETIDPFIEIKVTDDGCLLYNFDMLLLERA